MTLEAGALTAQPAWKALVGHHAAIVRIYARCDLKYRRLRSVRGVELSIVLAQRTAPELESVDEPELTHDSSPNTLIRRYRRLRKGSP
ncbi:MAG: hypothetical protein ABIX00_01740 [Polaromonas sp.]